MSSMPSAVAVGQIFPNAEEHLVGVRQCMIESSRDFVDRYNEGVFEQLNEFWKRPSKMFRSLVICRIVECLGGDLASAQASGAVLEIYHAASLIFDDIQDGSEVRRRGQCVHVTEGLSMAISVGAVMRSLMYHPIHQCDAMDESQRLAAHHIVDQTCTRVACGQAQEMHWRKRPDLEITADAYVDMVGKKTGSLIRAAFNLGAMLSGCDEALRRSLTDFGQQFGILFQLHNDWMDLSGGHFIGRPAYDDVRDGKRTSMVLGCLEQLRIAGRHDDLKRYRTLLQTDRLDDTQVQWCVDRLRETGQIEAAGRDLHRRRDRLSSDAAAMGLPVNLHNTLQTMLCWLVPKSDHPGGSSSNRATASSDHAAASASV